jgi:hypothetical protein
VISRGPGNKSEDDIRSVATHWVDSAEDRYAFTIRFVDSRLASSDLLDVGRSAHGVQISNRHVEIARASGGFRVDFVTKRSAC